MSLLIELANKKKSTQKQFIVMQNPITCPKIPKDMWNSVWALVVSPIRCLVLCLVLLLLHYSTQL